MIKLASLVLIVLSSSSAFAQYLGAHEIVDGLRFGSEMTISSDVLFKSYPAGGNNVQVTTPLAAKYLADIRASLEKKYAGQPNPPAFSLSSFHSHWSRQALSIAYSNGFKLTIFPDPGALELNSSPATVADIKENLPRIQHDYFDEGKKLGLEPAAFTGSGHIHIEVTKLDPITVRNFLADYFNATGLAAGALNEDVFNQIGIGEIPDKNKEILRQTFREFDKNPKLKLKDLQAIESKAYNIPLHAELPEYQKARGSKRPDKYFAVSFNSLLTLGTIEIRAIRPQASAASYLKLLKLFSLRMKLAEENRVKGIRTPLGELKSVRGNAQEVIAQFDKYLSEVGLRLEDYREFVMPWWQNEGGEFDQYLKHRRPGSCRALFG